MSVESDLLRALIASAPEIASTVRAFAGVRGIDLGPEPPDAEADFAAIDERIDAQLAARRRAEKS